MAFTYPFCYKPIPEIVSTAKELMRKIATEPELDEIFSEGKMLGVLMVAEKGKVKFLYAFSGLAGGRSIIDGFVPPIFDLNEPGSVYRAREAEISELNRRIRELESGDRDIRELKSLRRELSIALQDWLFRQYRVLNARGEWSSIREIFERRGIMPPGGTGDCAAPKLLQYAYLHNLQPLALGEFWYGTPPLRELRLQGCFYPACTGKCGPLLEYMMQGLDVEPNPLERDDSEFTAQLVIYSDDDIVVANKPAGMLSVPGRTASNSLLTLLRRRFGEDLQSCHRLDMDTSGVMVFARGLRNKSLIEKQFAEHSARKTYVARLISLPAADAANAGVDSGRIELPLIVDWDDRPRQMIDYEDGKEAVTDYVVIGRRPNGEMDVRFTPRTGRTHQLRVHAAHPAGLGRPIKGDRLYGAHPDSPASRLYLHAESLSFRHPATGEELTFTVPAEFPEE